jgi:hypothetical protein
MVCSPARQLFPAFLLIVLATIVNPASAQTTVSNIDQMTGWQSCSTCAGYGGNGPVTTHSMTQNLASPSLDGKSVKFSISGTTPYANALWWKQLGRKDTAHNFVYSLYYYIKDPAAAQALEFDVNQTVGSKWYVFGTECVLKGTPHWDVYDPYDRKWVATTIPCKIPTAYTWNHVVLEFHRTTTAQNQFISVTINGVKSYFNRTYSPKGASSNTLNVAFQMDMNKTATDYSTWVDKVSLKYW